MPMEVAIVDPEKGLFTGEADFLVARTEDGEIGVLPNHAPFLGVLKYASLMLEVEGGERKLFAVHSGFLMVKDNKVSVLARVAGEGSSIDVARAQEAQRRAEEVLRTEPEDAEAQRALLRAQARLKTAGELGLIVG